MSYLRGEAVDFALDADVDKLHLADTPDASRIQWLRDFPRVPVGVAATGPQVISIAARLADRVDLMLGASAKRIQWGMEVAREARRKEGMTGDVPFSAYVNLVVHDDGELAWKMAAPAITSQSRFAAMHGKAHWPGLGRIPGDPCEGPCFLRHDATRRARGRLHHQRLRPRVRHLRAASLLRRPALATRGTRRGPVHPRGRAGPGHADTRDRGVGGAFRDGGLPAFK
ncbi:MAG: LLM class flavin-dependent oxidoreductase [Gammaproteobacteria bacterium]|nr:LLM class flavin-dependent oxidoreductase [Gammaproteobacteria bacterium]